MKPLTPSEMQDLYCGLFATANFLEKAGKNTVFLGDNEDSIEKQRNEYLDRAAWCEAMGKTLKSRFLAEGDNDSSPWRSEKHPGRPLSPEQVEANRKLGLYD